MLALGDAVFRAISAFTALLLRPRGRGYFLLAATVTVRNLASGLKGYYYVEQGLMWAKDSAVPYRQILHMRYTA